MASSSSSQSSSQNYIKRLRYNNNNNTSSGSGSSSSQRQQTSSSSSPSSSSSLLNNVGQITTNNSNTNKNLLTIKQLEHLFIQFFLNRQCVTEEKLQALIQAYNNRYIEKRNNQTVDKQTLIGQCNRILRSIGLQIKHLYEPNTKNLYYILTNEIDDFVVSKNNGWSVKESNFYYSILDEIITNFLTIDDDDEQPQQLDMTPESINYDFIAIRTTEAINLARKASLSIILGEKLLKDWIKLHWFEKASNDTGNVTLGIRSLTQQTTYLTRKFSLLTCNRCGFVCLIGIQCDQCNYCVHYHCYYENLSSTTTTSSSRRNNVVVTMCVICNGSIDFTKLKRILPPPSLSSVAPSASMNDDDDDDNESIVVDDPTTTIITQQDNDDDDDEDDE